MVGPEDGAEVAEALLLGADEVEEGAAGGVTVAEGAALGGGAGVGFEGRGVEVEEGIDLGGVGGAVGGEVVAVELSDEGVARGDALGVEAEEGEGAEELVAGPVAAGDFEVGGEVVETGDEPVAAEGGGGEAGVGLDGSEIKLVAGATGPGAAAAEEVPFGGGGILFESDQLAIVAAIDAERLGGGVGDQPGLGLVAGLEGALPGGDALGDRLAVVGRLDDLATQAVLDGVGPAFGLALGRLRAAAAASRGDRGGGRVGVRGRLRGQGRHRGSPPVVGVRRWMRGSETSGAAEHRARDKDSIEVGAEKYRAFLRLFGWSSDGRHLDEGVGGGESREDWCGHHRGECRRGRVRPMEPATAPAFAFFRHPDGSWYRLWISHTAPKTERGHPWHLHASYDKSGTVAPVAGTRWFEQPYGMANWDFADEAEVVAEFRKKASERTERGYELVEGKVPEG